jgi:hypothetical protein
MLSFEPYYRLDHRHELKHLQELQLECNSRTTQINTYHLPFVPADLKSLTIVTLLGDKVDNWPTSLKKLTIQGQFDGSLHGLPWNLKHLQINDYQSRWIEWNHVRNLTHLILGDGFDQPIDHLPPQLLYLDLGQDFDQPLDHLPSTLIELILHSLVYNHNLDYLPESLRRLNLSHTGYSKALDYLPANLKHLQLPFDFHENLDYLPENLQELIINGTYTRPLDHLPRQLRYLKFDNNNSQYAHSLDHLPLSLTWLQIPEQCHPSLQWLPDHLETLYSSGAPDISRNLDYLPRHLSTLNFQITRRHNQIKRPSSTSHVVPENILYLCYLPQNLQHLEIWGIGFDQIHICLPSSLKILDAPAHKHTTFASSNY